MRLATQPALQIIAPNVTRAIADGAPRISLGIISRLS